MDFSYYNLLYKSTVTFIVLLLLTRILGKKQMGHLSFFNYITGITIGSIAGNIVAIENEHFYGELFNLFIWCAFTIILDIVSLKIPRSRVLFAGEPTVVIKRGEVVEKSLKKTRMTLDNLMMLLREEGVFSITEVEYAILESNGEVTIYRKEDNQSVTRKDIDKQYNPIKYLPCEIIVDGNVIKKNLKENNFNINWLEKELSKKKVKVEDVLYAELQTDGKLHVQKKN